AVRLPELGDRQLARHRQKVLLLLRKPRSKRIAQLRDRALDLLTQLSLRLTDRSSLARKRGFDAAVMTLLLLRKHRLERTLQLLVRTLKLVAYLFSDRPQSLADAVLQRLKLALQPLLNALIDRSPGPIFEVRTDTGIDRGVPISRRRLCFT